MTFQVKRHAVLLAGVEDRLEALDEQLQAHLAHIWYRMAAQGGRPPRKGKEMAPAMGWRSHESWHRHLPVLELAQVVGQANAVDQVLRRLIMDHPADVVGDIIGIGSRRLIALVAPGFVCRNRLAADELERLGAR